MGLSIEQCNQSIQALEKEVFTFQRQLRRSTIKFDELEKIDQKIQQTIIQLNDTLNILQTESQDQGCFIWSEKKLAILSGLTVILTGGGVIFTAFAAETLKWVGVTFTVLAGGATGCTTCYTGKMSIDEKKKARLKELSQEGLKNAELFKKFIRSFKQLKKDEMKELRHNVKQMERRKSRLIEQKEKSELESQKVQSDKEPNRSLGVNHPSTEDIKEIKLPEPIVTPLVWNSLESASQPELNGSTETSEVKLQVEPNLLDLQIYVKKEDSDVDNSKLLDEKITQCLNDYEALPEKFKDKKGDLYLRLVSTFIQHLPDHDPVKKEFTRLTQCQDKILPEISSPNLKDDSVFQAPSISNGKDDSEYNNESSLEISNVTLLKVEDKDIAKRYHVLADTVAKRFKIRRPLPHLDAPNGYRVTSRGTVRVKRKESSHTQSSFMESATFGEISINIASLSQKDNDRKENRKRSESNLV